MIPISYELNEGDISENQEEWSNRSKRDFTGGFAPNGGARSDIEKSGGVAEGHDAGFLLYCGERPKGARSDIEGSTPTGGVNGVSHETHCLPTSTLVKEFGLKKIPITKPILKWVGGKTQIIDNIIAEFPVEMNNYHEIFLGGGSVLFAVLSYIKRGIIKIHGKVYAYDWNDPLIHVYKNIQSRHHELYHTLQTIITEFNECGNGSEINRLPANIEEAKQMKENYYYWIRNRYNELSVENKKDILGSAMFIFLNKTCFRGLFRTGPRGFNVPYGHYKSPEIINKDHLEEIHELIQDVIFDRCDFSISLKKVESTDFVYLDPPYAPEKSTSFVKYNENGFTIDDHKKLFEQVHILTNINKKVFMNNADVNLVRENFTSRTYNITSIICRRAINSKNPESNTRELIIKNY